MAQFSVLNYWRSYSHFKVGAVILILLIGLTSSTEGLRICYHCNTSVSLDCVNNPSNVTDGEISCKGVCTIRRKDYIYMPEGHSLIFLQRTCERSPLYFDSVVEHGYFREYYRSCKSYLCNVGLGLHSLRDMPEDLSWDLYPDENTASGGACVKCFFYNVFLITLFSLSFIISALIIL